MSSGGNRTWRTTLALWAAVLAVCAAIGGASWVAEASRRRALAEQRRRRVLSTELHSSVSALRDQTLEEIEARLNRGRPLPRVPGSDEFQARVVAPGEALDPRFKGWTVRLKFFRLWGAPHPATNSAASIWEGDDVIDQSRFTGTDDGSRHYLYSYSATPPAEHTGPFAETLLQAERIRRATLVFGALGWVIALLTLPFARRWRRQVAQVMLACVLVAAVGWAAEPSHWSGAGARAPLPAALGVTAVLSVAVMLPPVRSKPAATPRCHACGYDLTGNVSGICPECGHPTPRGKVERWRGIAERIAHVGEPEEVDEIPLPPAETA